MTRRGGTLRRLKPLKGIIFLILLIFVIVIDSMGNYRVFDVAKKVFESYRIEVSTDNMQLQNLDDGSTQFIIRINATRNTFDMALMVGFIAGGRVAEAATDLQISRVKVVVVIPYRESITIEASSTFNEIQSLLNGKLSTTEFMRKHVIFN
jgi:hypothetical protein